MDEGQRAALHAALGLGTDAGGLGKAVERMEWSMWRQAGLAEARVGRKVSRGGLREASRLMEAESRRRMGPFREALGHARKQGSERAWIAAMEELAQAAMEADCPEREAANLLSAARVDPRTLPAAAARALRGALSREREFAQEPGAGEGFEGGGREGRLSALWLALLERAQDRC